MEQKFERVMDADGKPIRWPYIRKYGNRRIKLFYAIFTDWQHIRRRIPLGRNLTLQQAIKKLGDVEKKNTNEFDFDEAKMRNITFSAWAEQCKSAFKPRDFSLLPHLERFFGSIALSKITDKEILDYRKIREGQGIVSAGKERARKISPTTINKELGF